MNKKIKTIRAVLLAASVILVLSFIVMVGAGLNEIRESRTRYGVETSDYLNALRAHDYERLLQTACDDSEINSPEDGERAEYRALAGYFRTELLRASYEAVGEYDKAQQQLDEREAFGTASAAYRDYQQEILERVNSALLD